MRRTFEHLLRPGKIGSLNLKNRVVFNPCETLFTTVGGEITKKGIDFFVRRAEGGAALLVTNSAQACTRLDPIDPLPHSLRIDDNAFIPMLEELTESVHRAGAKIAMLVSAGGGAQAMGFSYSRGFEGVTDVSNVGASEVQSLVARKRVRRLRVDEIRKIIEVYGLSAKRVAQAGFDAFYIHALGGHLISQFISPRFNIRDDEYGKNFDGRIRFLLEIVESCRKNLRPDFPLVVRLSIDEFFPGGRGVEESVRIAKRLEEAGVDAIDAGAGVYESMHMILPTIYSPKGCLVYLAEAVKKEVGIPVIAQGRLHEPAMADGVISEGKADFIAVTRGMLADPCWVNKVQDGREKEIRKCISCNQCIDRPIKGLTIRCSINPTVGRESEYWEVPQKALKPKKVVVVGAGPGGMEAARVAAERGHYVTVFEKTGELGGGQLKLATVPPFKDEYLNISRYYESQFGRLRNVKIMLNKTANLEDIESENPDFVILATGASPSIPEIEGIAGKKVVSIHDVLRGTAMVHGRVAIAGAGCAGAGTADLLSDKGIDVTLVDALDECAIDEETTTRLVLLARLMEKNNVKMMLGHTIKKVIEEGIVAVDKDNNVVVIPADFIVLAFGAVPYNPLEDQVKERYNYYVIGDAKQPKKIKNAVEDGFFAGQLI